MKRLLLLCFLFAIGSIHSQASLRSMTPELDDALLWEISGNGLTNSSFLYGTFHTMNGTFLDSVPKFYTSFGKVKQVVAEVDMVNQQAPASPQIDMSIYTMPKDTTYKMLFSNEDFKFVDSCLTTVIPQSIYSVKKPGYISLMYTMLTTPDLKSSESGLDKFILTKATEKGQKVIGLETMDEHVNYIIRIYKSVIEGSVKDQADLLLFELRNPQLTEGVMAEMKSLYRRQMLNKLMEPSQKMEEKIKEFFPQYSDEKVEEASEKMMAGLVDERNDNWLKKIPQMMRENPSFIAVGASHLIGEKGLINQLRKMGYTVKPVK